MMFANLRGADGQVLGSVAVDPTKPGGLQNELANAVQRLQANQGAPFQTGRPIPPGLLPPGPPQPVSQSRPFVCYLRYMTRGPDGQPVLATRAIACPVGLPPGVYTFTPGG